MQTRILPPFRKQALKATVVKHRVARSDRKSIRVNQGIVDQVQENQALGIINTTSLSEQAHRLLDFAEKSAAAEAAANPGAEILCKIGVTGIGIAARGGYAAAETLSLELDGQFVGTPSYDWLNAGNKIVKGSRKVIHVTQSVQQAVLLEGVCQCRAHSGTTYPALAATTPCDGVPPKDNYPTTDRGKIEDLLLSTTHGTSTLTWCGSTNECVIATSQ